MAKKGGGEYKEVNAVKEEKIAETENLISVEEFAVNCPKEKLWIDGLRVHAGAEPKTLSAWKNALERFKNEPK